MGCSASFLATAGFLVYICDTVCAAAERDRRSSSIMARELQLQSREASSESSYHQLLVDSLSVNSLTRQQRAHRPSVTADDDHTEEGNTPFTRSSKHRANIKQAGWNPALWLKCRLTADHVLYRPSIYNPPALLISMLIIIARRACWMNASKHRADVKQTSSKR